VRRRGHVECGDAQGPQGVEQGVDDDRWRTRCGQLAAALHAKHVRVARIGPVDGDVVVHEASAISIYLADKHPECGLAPAADDPAHGAFLTWMLYLSNTLQIAYQMTCYPGCYTKGEENHAASQARSCERLREIWGCVDAALEGTTWLVGERFSAADVHLHMFTTWLSPEMGPPTMDAFPNAKRVADAVAERPTVQMVHAF